MTHGFNIHGKMHSTLHSFTIFFYTIPPACNSGENDAGKYGADQY